MRSLSAESTSMAYPILKQARRYYNLLWSFKGTEIEIFLRSEGTGVCRSSVILLTNGWPVTQLRGCLFASSLLIAFQVLVIVIEVTRSWEAISYAILAVSFRLTPLDMRQAKAFFMIALATLGVYVSQTHDVFKTVSMLSMRYLWPSRNKAGSEIPAEGLSVRR